MSELARRICASIPYGERVSRGTPLIDLTDLADDTYRWHVTWWTDRAGPVEVVLPSPKPTRWAS